MRLIVIAPLAYRPSKGHRLRYRKPPCLICTDPTATPEDVLNAYVARWDTEVNSRDEKQLFGLDQARVRTEPSARLAPALAASACALLLLAAVRPFGINGIPQGQPAPKWRRHSPPPRTTTAMLINHLRFEPWSRAIVHTNFSNFPTPLPATPNPEKYLPRLPSTLFYANPAA